MTIGTPEKGFTLVELMVTILVAAIVLAFAIPSFRTTTQDSRLTSQINRVTSAINYARSEAIKTKSSVSICGSSDQVNCNTGNFELGWVISSNPPRIGIGMDNTTLRLNSPASTTVLQFDGDGLLANQATFTLCDDRGASEAKAIVMNVSGQARLAVDEDSPSDGIVNDHNGNNVTCP